VINPLIDLSLNGGMSVLFTYGQTGAGKTYTVNGILERIA
jgi:DNA repair ATPase RecN